MTLYRWLKKEGLPVSLRFCSPAECCSLMGQSRSGILLYLHTRGGHYTAYENAGGGRLHFYNAVYGRQNMIMDPAEFFRKYVFVPATILIYVT